MCLGLFTTSSLNVCFLCDGTSVSRIVRTIGTASSGRPRSAKAATWNNDKSVSKVALTVDDVAFTCSYLLHVRKKMINRFYHVCLHHGKSSSLVLIIQFSEKNSLSHSISKWTGFWEKWQNKIGHLHCVYVLLLQHCSAQWRFWTAT